MTEYIIIPVVRLTQQLRVYSCDGVGQPAVDFPMYGDQSIEIYSSQWM